MSDLTDEQIEDCAAHTLGEMHAENCGFTRIKGFAMAIIAAQRQADKPIAEIHWGGPNSDWQLTMLCEPSIAEDVRIKLYDHWFDSVPMLIPETMEIVGRQAGQEPLCPSCKGSGEETVSTYGNGPNDYDMEIDCRQCGGVGCLSPAMILADKIMDLAEMMGNDPEATHQIDARAWQHLLVYAPKAEQEPYGWQVAGTRELHTGEHAEADARASAKRVGGTCTAFPLYTAPQPVARAAQSIVPVTLDQGRMEDIINKHLSMPIADEALFAQGVADEIRAALLRGAHQLIDQAAQAVSSSASDEPTRTEPKIHSHIEDGLPDECPQALMTFGCLKCGVMIHAGNNECMRTWVATGIGNFCLPCFTVMDDSEVLEDVVGLPPGVVVEYPKPLDLGPLQTDADGNVLYGASKDSDHKVIGVSVIGKAAERKLVIFRPEATLTYDPLKSTPLPPPDEPLPSFIVNVADFAKSVDPLSGKNLSRYAAMHFRINGDGTLTMRPRQPYAGAIEPQDQTCQHCRHWERDDAGHHNRRRGVCDNMDDALDGDTTVVLFKPSEDFGCNKFEGKS